MEFKAKCDILSLKMSKKLLTIFLFLIFISVTIFVGWKLLPQAVNFSGLQVIANGSEADIYLGSEKIGRTPYENEKLHPGDYILKLIPVNKKFKSWSHQVTLTTGAMTTVERFFSEDAKRQGGLIVFLSQVDDKMSRVDVVTNPDSATLYFNKENKGKTPALISDVPAGNQEVILKKDGYEDQIYKIDTVSGFKVSLIYDLLAEKSSPQKTKNDKPKTLGATDSAKIASPTQPKSASGAKTMIQIEETGTGWLRVRESPTTSASESAKVDVGQKFEAIDEQNGWIKIEYVSGSFGWVSSEFVKKL